MSAAPKTRSGLPFGIGGDDRHPAEHPMEPAGEHADREPLPYDSELLDDVFSDIPAPRGNGHAPTLAANRFFGVPGDDSADSQAWIEHLSTLSSPVDIDAISQTVSESVFDEPTVPVEPPPDASAPVAAALATAPPASYAHEVPAELTVELTAPLAWPVPPELCAECSIEPTRWEVISHRLWVAAAAVVGSTLGILLGLLGFAGWLGYTNGWESVTDFLPTRQQSPATGQFEQDQPESSDATESGPSSDVVDNAQTCADIAAPIDELLLLAAVAEDTPLTTVQAQQVTEYSQAVGQFASFASGRLRKNITTIGQTGTNLSTSSGTSSGAAETLRLTAAKVARLCR